MKRIRKFMIILYIIMTVLVIIIQPIMHKPVALESTNFNLKKQLMNPEKRIVSDYEVKLKWKIYHKHKPIAKNTQIHIKPDFEEDKKITMNTESQTISRDIYLQSDENIKSGGNLQLDLSNKDSKYKEDSLKITDQASLYREEEMRIEQQDFPQTEMELNITDNSEVALTDSDEIGNRNFKASREEIIAWNDWRSRLQNKIMDESKIEAPVGTLILFSFDVSDKRKISNLKYSCSNRRYTSIAREDMIRVLEGLQYSLYLKFPKSTQRKKVRFKGGFLLDYTTQYSSPSDYSDFERVNYD